MSKRKLDICVISDVHLGTYGCHAKELNKYLKSIQPEALILNGDIIDIWQFSKNYWPEAHAKVLQRILKMIAQGTKVYYLTGNHDEVLRKYTDFKLGNLEIINKLLLEIDGNKTWIFHGDVFDITMKHSKWLAKLGSNGYDLLILVNRFVNFISEKVFKKGKISLSKKIKNSVKQAIKFIDDFEKTATDIAIENKYDTVICGHIHQPQMKKVKNEKGEVLYLNSGDWIENLSALELLNNEWRVFYYRDEMENKPEFEDILEENNEDEISLSQTLYEDIIRHTRNG